ncbi:MAG: 5-(carboxyamino)imidazole ribonucleotide synthase [Gammaproteobacteria bacterium]|jgi:5-(carboxyamino)imidazole ribonucleotide synthase|nr:5-(carboxyamino)imidazole ribonucleotide synthase [Gammaproteobacteria bacterium]
MILPGATLGLLGGGQLGRMFTAVARTRGYEVLVLDPDPSSPAAQFASAHLCAPYEDEAAISELGVRSAAVTIEFENVPATVLERLAQRCVVRPGAATVAICQGRVDEKGFLSANGFPVAPWAPVRSAADLELAVQRVGLPALLKLDRLGYDGKGQAVVADLDEARAAFAVFGGQPCILERRIDLAAEVSVVLARGADGAVAPFPVAENRHRNGILDLSVAPAEVRPELAAAATRTACAIAAALDYVGVIGVEFFIDTDGRLLVNELAPRPHNSGHYTLDACLTSQFEQQLRALCGMPLGDPAQVRAAAMVNILGDAWRGGEPRWSEVLGEPDARLHLYGKREPRPGRKMGHYTCLADTPERARELAGRLRDALTAPVSP